MAKYTGKDLVLSWIYSGGTVSLGGDYRQCNWNPSIGKTDKSAGSDAQKTYLSTQKDVTASVTLVAQAGGTALEDALAPGVEGTLIIQPEGTASGKRKHTLPCFSDGIVPSYPYNDIVVYNCSFTPTAAYTSTTN
jgi:hypothetical protein